MQKVSEEALRKFYQEKLTQLFHYTNESTPDPKRSYDIATIEGILWPMVDKTQDLEISRAELRVFVDKNYNEDPQRMAKIFPEGDPRKNPLLTQLTTTTIGTEQELANHTEISIDPVVAAVVPKRESNRHLTALKEKPQTAREQHPMEPKKEQAEEEATAATPVAKAKKPEGKRAQRAAEIEAEAKAGKKPKEENKEGGFAEIWHKGTDFLSNSHNLVGILAGLGLVCAYNDMKKGSTFAALLTAGIALFAISQCWGRGSGSELVASADKAGDKNERSERTAQVDRYGYSSSPRDVDRIVHKPDSLNHHRV